MNYHDKKKSYLSSPYKSALIKIPKKQENPNIAKVTHDVEKPMSLLDTPINKADKWVEAMKCSNSIPSIDTDPLPPYYSD